MREHKFYRVTWVTFLFAMTLLVISCGEEEVISNWNDNSIVIDGNQKDWQGKLHYLADERSALGVANDDNNLYLCLATNDTSKLFQIFATGLTVWIESQNSGEKIGIQYPLKSDDIRGMMHMRNRPGERKMSDMNSRLTEFKNKQSELRIVNEDNFPLTAYYLNNEIGIEVDIGSRMGQLVYEIMIPYSKPLFPGHDLHLFPGDDILLSFESGEFSGGNIGSRQKPSGFGINGRGGKGGGRRSGGGGRGGPKSPGLEKIDFSVHVKLALL